MSLGKPGFGSGLGQPGVATRSPSAPAGPLNLTNVQKLALPANTPAGTVVQVTDGFVVSGFGDARDGFWNENTSLPGNYYRFPILVDFGSDNHFRFNDTIWEIGNGDAGYVQADGPSTSTEFGGAPWDATWTGVGITLTHPAVQTLAAPSTAQGGVFVSGGTQDGVFVNYTEDGYGGGKGMFRKLGTTGTNDNGDFDGYYWEPSGTPTWYYTTPLEGGSLYYSLSDVATPDLASNWKNASDDTPASITVTSVSQGELDAGLAVTNNGVTNGSSYVSQPFHGRQYYMGLNGGGSNNLHWDTDYNVWTDDVGAWTSDNVAFPWQGADNGGGYDSDTTFARNDVASEANWQ